MVHKTISAANELRAPPLAQWKRPKLVNHSRKVGIEQTPHRGQIAPTNAPRRPPPPALDMAGTAGQKEQAATRPACRRAAS
jgi:hypothetical protein